MADPYGLDCPAARPLCLCGVRGCPDVTRHRRRFVFSTRRWWDLRRR